MTANHPVPRRPITSLSRWRDALLTIGAVVGSLCIVIAVAGALFDVRALVFRSGSMSPEIDTGALAFAKDTPADRLAVGDVVSVVASNGARVTHRIQEVTLVGDTAQMTLKGDANGSPDAETYVVSSADRVLFDVPYVGYAVGYATSPIGVFAGGILVGGLLWLIVRPTRGSGGHGRRDRGGRRRAGATVVVAAIAVGGTVAQAPTSTLAYFSDTGTIDSGPVSTHTMVSQAQPSCLDSRGLLILGNDARLSWLHVDARYEYAWQQRRLDGTVEDSGTVGAGQAAGSTVNLDIDTGLIGTNRNYNVAVRARLIGSPTWVAGTETLTQVHRTSILIVGVTMRCGHA